MTTMRAMVWERAGQPLVPATVPRPVPGLKVWESTALIKDTWVKVDGQWWYLPEKQ